MEHSGRGSVVQNFALRGALRPEVPAGSSSRPKAAGGCSITIRRVRAPPLERRRLDPRTLRRPT